MQVPYFIYRLLSIYKRQIDRVLPKRFWDRVQIIESNEPMVSFQGFLMRKAVAEKLGEVEKLLPEEIGLKVLDGYRSLERQKQNWDQRWTAVRQEHPEWSASQVDYEVALVTARPQGTTNHVCGGAVDVMLVYKDGAPLPFGTVYAPSDDKGRAKCPMFAKDLKPEEVEARKLLREVMEAVGFVWYPGEWWHYCYDDRMWALYTGRKTCSYGPIEIHE